MKFSERVSINSPAVAGPGVYLMVVVSLARSVRVAAWGMGLRPSNNSSGMAVAFGARAETSGSFGGEKADEGGEEVVMHINSMLDLLRGAGLAGDGVMLEGGFGGSALG